MMESLAASQCVPRSVVDLILWHARNRPDATAVSFGNTFVSYAELDFTSTKIAHLLREKGLQPRDRVVVLTTRCPEMVASFLGVLKAGACYIPMDIEAWSTDRIRSTLAVVAAKLVITTRIATYPGYNVLTYEEIRTTLYSADSIDLNVENSSLYIKPTDLAYIIFTSGTTGAPKGVMIPHRALLNYVQHGGDDAPFNMNVTLFDKVLLIFSVAFDACTGVIFSTLCHGGHLIISDSSRFEQSSRICSILPVTPSILSSLQDPQSYMHLRVIYLGGEAPPQALIRKWQTPRRRMFNCYGPTETTCASMISELRPNHPICLGIPMSNSSVILLNATMEASHEGEICVSGPGLATGYYENEQLTAQKFIDWKGTRFYRTGDFGRRTQHGLEFMGRRDSLVKNRGYLINLESQVIPALLSYPGALSATALIHQGRLNAFVTPGGLDSIAMRKHLSQQYDTFLVPDKIRTVDALPISSNGKIDTCAIAKWLDVEVASVSKRVSTGESRMDTLKSAVSVTLNLPLGDVYEGSSFWDLGGSSLSAVKLLSHLHTNGLSISMARLFAESNLTAVCGSLDYNLLSSGNELACGDQYSATDRDNLPASTSIVPMTTVQMKMIRASLTSPAVNYIILSMSLEHYGKSFSPGQFREAWDAVLKRHSIFRTIFDMESGLQIIENETRLDWTDLITTLEDWDSTYDRESQDIYKQIRAQDRDNFFYPTLSFRLITAPAQKSALLWMVHHCQIDGWSVGLIFKEVQAVLDGKQLPDVPQFSDIAGSQEMLARSTRDEAQRFWAEVRDQHLPPVPLTLPKPDPSTVSTSPAELKLDFGFTPSQIEKAARSLHVSSATIFYGAWAALLSNYSSTDRVIFGAVLSGRSIPMPSADQVVGPLINTCPFPFCLKDNGDKVEALLEVQRCLLKINDFQWHVEQSMRGITSDTYAGIFTSVVATQYDLPEYSWNSETMSGPWKFSHQETPEFGLYVLIESESNKLVVRILFDTSLYKASTVNRILEHFRNLVHAFLAPQFHKLGEVLANMVDSTELKSLMPSSADFPGVYNGHASLKDALEMAAYQWPELIAVESSMDSLTYKELDEASLAVACHLRTIIRRGEVVGVLSDGSLRWIVSIIAVIKAGAVCAPIDINLPLARIKLLVNQAKLSFCLLPNKSCENAFPLDKLATLRVDDFLVSGKFHMERLETITQLNDPAYLVFTSGSTGVPKGVQVSHVGILNFISYPPARLHAAPGRKNAQLFSLGEVPVGCERVFLAYKKGFDGCTGEIFGTLCYGATLVLKDQEDPFAHLQRVDAMMATPSFLSTCSPNDLQKVDTILLIGEPVTQRLSDAWSGGRRLYNSYGPCECAFLSTLARLLPGEVVTIGVAIPRMAVYLLDSHVNPVPVGVPGEIYISGIQVTDGYFQLQSATKARFLPNPFLVQEKMYRTGDLGVWNDSMQIRYVGRLDNQAKIRGFRVELEEVEWAILRADPSVTGAAVVVHSGCLVAFVTPETTNRSALNKRLALNLPQYARPSQIIALTTFPLSPNQKLDRTALAQLTGLGAREKNFPCTQNEKMVAKVWKEVIGHPDDAELDINDEFMMIGGNSLLQIKVARQISQVLGYKIPMTIIVRNTMLSDLAKAIEKFSMYYGQGRVVSEPFLLLRQAPLQQTIELSHLEEEMFLHHSMSDTKSMFNLAVKVELRGEVDCAGLSAAADALLAKNEILQARYINNHGVPERQIVHDFSKCRRLSDGFLKTEVLETEINRPFDLENEPLIRILLLEKNAGETCLVIVIHHIIADKASIASILRSIQSNYLQLSKLEDSSSQSSDSVSTEPSAIIHSRNYVEWALWTKTNRVSSQGSELSSFWQEYLQDLPPKPFTPMTSIFGSGDGSTCSFFIPYLPRSALSQQLAVAAVALTIHSITGINDIVIGLPYMDRSEPGTSDIIGLLLDRLLVRLRLTEENLLSTKTLLASVQSNILDALSNYAPYYQIRRALEVRSSLFDIMVVFHWQQDSLEKAFQLPGVTSTLSPVRSRGAKFPLLFEFTEREEEDLFCEIDYNHGLVTDSQIEAMQSILPQLMGHLSQGKPTREIIFESMPRANRTTSSLRVTAATSAAAWADEETMYHVRSAFAEALTLDVGSINCNRSFFDLGGSSLLCLRVSWLLKQRGLDVSFRDVLLGETAEGISKALKRSRQH